MGLETMNWRKQIVPALLVAAVVLGCWFLPDDLSCSWPGVREALHLLRWYARQHVLFSLFPAILIAGAIVTFARRDFVASYVGAGAPRKVAYGVAAVSGAILTVCSCSVLPLFAGVCRMGAGIGPAMTLLYAGPAINVMAIVMTAQVLGFGLGAARAVAALVLSVAIGLTMGRLFPDPPAAEPVPAPETPDSPAVPLWRSGLFVAAMAAVIVFTNWARSGDVRAVFLCCPNGVSTYEVTGAVVGETADELRLVGTDRQVHQIRKEMLQSLEPVAPRPGRDVVQRLRWLIVVTLLVTAAAMGVSWFSRGQLAEWAVNSWCFTTRIVFLLLLGVAASGFVFGRPGSPGLIPAGAIEALLGNSPERMIAAAGLDGTWASFLRFGWPVLVNLLAATVGAFMYFATLTEVPILQGLMASGMGQGPALALLLAGPAVSLPSLLVLIGVIGARRAWAYVGLTILFSAAAGILYGAVCAWHGGPAN
jgi:uncharacterized membrane protein YraQ (UPF0718 family)